MTWMINKIFAWSYSVGNECVVNLHNFNKLIGKYVSLTQTHLIVQKCVKQYFQYLMVTFGAKFIGHNSSVLFIIFNWKFVVLMGHLIAFVQWFYIL